MRRILWRAAVYAVLAITLWTFLAPLLWLALTSFKSEEEVYAEPDRWLPQLPDPSEAGIQEESAGQPLRLLLLGRVRLLSRDGNEYEPRADLPISRRWSASGEGGVALQDVVRQGLPYAEARYQFGPGGQWAVEVVAELTFPAARLEAVQLDYQPDDSWHRIDCRVEHADGTAFRSARSYPLAGSRLLSHQWRVGDDEEDTPRIREWVRLDPSRADSTGPLGPNQVRVVLTVSRAGRADAAWSKIRYHYDRVFASVPCWRYFRTSVFLALTNALLMTFGSALAAYSFARLSWPGRDLCFVVLLATVLFPPQLTLVPQFLIWKQLGAYDTLFPLWLSAAFGNGFFVFLLRGAVRAVSPELEDAARMDGCGPFRVLWHAVLPQLAPSLAAIATFSFLASWNDFLGPLLYLADQRLYPLSFGTYALAVYSGNEPTLTSASAVLLTLPPLVCFFLLQRYIMRLSIGPAVKG